MPCGFDDGRTHDDKHRCKINNHHINKYRQKPIDDDEHPNRHEINIITSTKNKTIKIQVNMNVETRTLIITCRSFRRT